MGDVDETKNGLSTQPLSNDQELKERENDEIVTCNTLQVQSTQLSSDESETMPIAPITIQDETIMNDEEKLEVLQKKLQEMEVKAELYEKMYSKASMLLQEYEQQRDNTMTQNSPTAFNINLEYLKNVVLKYICSQNNKEKQTLISVIAMILQFSPKELQMASAAQALGHSDSGFLGGMWSILASTNGTNIQVPKHFAQSLILTDPSSIREANAVEHNHDTFNQSFEDDGIEEMNNLNPFAI